ncbi:MAG: dihydrofolate reductase [Cellulosilyticaceae bacterium]
MSKETMITMIVAMARNYTIGVSGKLPWHIPEDLAYFKEQTFGRPIVMGRKTFESIGRVLPGRTNIVLTTDHHFVYPGVKVYHDKETLMQAYADQDLMIIGGGQIYKLFYPDAQKLLITSVDEEVVGDVHFMAIKADFRLVKESGPRISGAYTYRFTEWLRK